MQSRHYLVTGGAGFIGSNYVDRLLSRGERVTIYDNLSRTGADRNIEWLQEKHGARSFRIVVDDVCNADSLVAAAQQADVIVHLASQVAVTTSVQNPRLDFETNALGTLNVLEAARLSGRQPVTLYASTNKVYGGMESAAVVEGGELYSYRNLPLGVPETQPLDFLSPYGCSKGAGDQYVRDYHRIYGLPSVVFRQSCIYGPRQFGMEDQGWVAWFTIAAITGRPITIYGDGKQARDILYIDDLLDIYDLAIDNIERVAGQVYNTGGGPGNVISVWSQFGPILERLLGHAIPVRWGEWRPGDQRVYVSDIRKAERDLGWGPKIGAEQGIQLLAEWIKSHRSLFS